MSESTPDDPAGPRRVAWGYWLAGIVLFFPSCLFLVMGMARLLSWPRSVLMALASFSTKLIIAQMMIDLGTSHASDLSLKLALAGATVVDCAWGQLIYEIGQKMNYWSPRWQRGWQWAAWLAMFVLSLFALVIAQEILSPGSGPS